MDTKSKRCASVLLHVIAGLGVAVYNVDVCTAQSTHISSPEDVSDRPDIPSTPPPSQPPSPSPSRPSSPPLTPTVTPPSSPPSTPPPSVTPPPTPEICSYITGTLNDKGTKHGRYFGNSFEKYGDSSKFGCIDRLIAQVKGSSKNWHQYWNDDSYATKLSSIIFPDKNGKSQKVGVHSNGAVCDRLYNGDVPKGKNYCGVGKFYMDANTCSIIPVPTGLECARFELNYYKGCPISLIWEKDAEVGNGGTIVKFSLGQNKSDWTLWKGSEKTPLLVYDPLKTSHVTSAEQLFGEWTFGGQKVATLNSSSNSDLKSVSPKPWKHGYEALAQLDSDKNDKIDGKELDDLALWFDKNQDAISQTGEVKRISDLGVTSIYYKELEKTHNGDLIAIKGFERKIGNHLETGKSVDWYTTMSDSPLDLINLHEVQKSFEKLEAEIEKDAAASEVKDSEELKGAPSKFSGLWKWSVSADKIASENFGGYLTFTRSDNAGNLFGYSINERPFEVSPSVNVRTGGSIFALEGYETMVNGRHKISFESEYDGNVVESRAFLSHDSRTLNGKSVVKGKSQSGEEVDLTYYWIAVKEEI